MPDLPDKQNINFQHRIATADDIPAVMSLMQLAIERNMRQFLSSDEIEAVKESMGLDNTLIEDGTYFLIETVQENDTLLVGCGGWGKRRTLYGGDQTAGRNDEFADPDTEPARIRAMYTHPDWVRKGIGSLLLDLGENAARAAGFQSIELGATVAGEPLYRARGYTEIDRESHSAANGTESLVIRMRKTL